MNNRITDIRKKTGLSQSKFASKYKIPLRSLQEWEQGRKEPADYFIRLLEKEVENGNTAKYIIMHEDTPTMKLVYQGNSLIDSTILTDKSMLIPIKCKVDEASVYCFLESRCYENGREDLKRILAYFNMLNNNPWEWIEHTHGATYEDCWWIKREGDNISWEQVKVR